MLSNYNRQLLQQKAATNNIPSKFFLLILKVKISFRYGVRTVRSFEVVSVEKE